MKKITNRVIALLLVVSLVCGFAVPATAAGAKLSFTKVENGTAGLDKLEAVKNSVDEITYKATDMVRVSIVLEEKSTVQAGFSTMDIAQNEEAMEYNRALLTKQQTMAETISAKALNGKKLDVVWNMTLAGNIISANVPYGKIEAIKGISGVKSVVIEQRYEPEVVSKEETAEPEMYISGSMIGSFNVWNSGYTGAGSRVAIIDTGSDTDHQSLDNGAFLYALQQNAAAEGMTYDEYVAGLDLLDAEEIASVIEELNAYERTPDLAKAENLYLSEKLPFGYNYIDKDLDIVHDNDGQGEHGSHVAGIAVANRYIPADEGYVDALSNVFTAGVAPDAQLITMKVFGKGGGAYDSDYMAAIEDAIILGCDSVNLSLGSGNPGVTYTETYGDLMDYLAQTETVVVTSAGNSGHWAESTVLGQGGILSSGYLYNDGVSFATGGTPGTFANMLSVASVDNAGTIDYYFVAGGKNVVYVENLVDSDTGEAYGNVALGTLDTSEDGSGTAYEYIFVDGIGVDSDFEGIDLTGKIVFCSRGETSFFEKANVAASRGAAATIIYNNQAGAFGMLLSGYEYTAPCVSILQSDAAAIKAASEAQTTEGGVAYYTGRMTVLASIGPIVYEDAYYTMSSFSSWGVPGDLSIKPEITAPGGGIYSLNGVDTSGKGYELMSGTSMAAPQVSGMMALVAQYLRETGLQAEGLTTRALAQSLLMSTAEPLIDGNCDSYYSVLNQGAGLARVDLATSAESYVLVDGMADGKVKVELGDDPQRTGVYQFGFSINNLNGEEMEYALAADFFTQDVFSARQYGILHDTWTRLLPADVVFTVDGDACESVVVPANGSVSINVTMTLGDNVKAYFDAYYPTGAYVEAYVHAIPAATAEGVMGVSHSIPVLGFYGSWSESSMFDIGSYIDYSYELESRYPYLYFENDFYGNAMSISYGDGEEYYFGGNPLLYEDEYLPQRNAMNNLNGSALEKLYFSLIRNASASKLVITNTETGEVYMDEEVGAINGAYYYVNGQEWRYTQRSLKLNWNGTDANGEPLPEGTSVEIAFIAAPELYRIDAETTDWDALSEGSYMVNHVTIDNTAPEITALSVNMIGKTGINVSAKDNQYIAAIVVLNANGTQELAYVAPNQTTAGEEVHFTFEEISAPKFQVVVYDYAMNASTYEVVMGNASDDDRPYFTAIDYVNEKYVGMEADGTLVDLAAVAGREYPVAAEYIDGYVFEISSANELYVAQDSDLTAFEYICNLDPNGEMDMQGFLDIAYNKVDGLLYGLFYSGYNDFVAPYLCSIDPLMGAVEVICEMPIDAVNLAIDGEGNFYSTLYGGIELYTYTLESLRGGAGPDCDLNGDGGTNELDVYYLLDYVVGNVTELYADGDINGDSLVNTYDAHLLLASFESRDGLVTYIGDVGDYACDSVNSMAWDHNTDELYWACTTQDATTEELVTTLMKVDVETAEPTVVAQYAQATAGLYIRPTKENSSIFDPTDEVVSVEISTTEAATVKGGTTQLTANVWPWNVSDGSVTWSSSDETVATVDETGLISGVGEGTAIITATSVLDPTKSASCEVSVAVLNRDLNGIVWDENGEVWWSKFNTDTLPAYEKLTEESEEARLISASFGADGVLYAADLNGNVSTLYTVDPETLESTAIGTSEIAAYTDLSYAAYLNDGCPISTYFNYVLTVDPATGEYSGAWDWLPDGTLIGIAYAGSQLNTYYNEYMDFFYLLDIEGNLYMEAFMTLHEATPELDAGNYMFYGPEKGYLGQIGEAVDYEYFQSLYYDGTYLYWSRFNEADNVVELLVCDIDNTGNVYSVGNFGEGVWPVAGLINLDSNPFATESVIADETAAAAQVKAAMSTEAITPVALSEENKVQSLVKSASLRESADIHSSSESYGHDIYVDITSEIPVTNGLVEVTYDPSVLTFVDGGSSYWMAGTVEEGKIIVAYAAAEEIPAEEWLASLMFTTDKTHVETDVIIKTIERNAEFGLAEEETVHISFGCPSAHFEDVGANSWYHEAVDFAVENGLMRGMSETTFGPNETMDRAQLVTILHRLVGEMEPTTSVTFEDVPADAYYAKAVAWAYENGIVVGKDATHFAPKEAVTREQMVVFLARFAQCLGVTIPEGATIEGFEDADQVSSYAVDAMAWAIENGLIQGMSDGKLAPKGTSTRAQIATVLMRFIYAL